jgi:hypothetical protein
VHGYGKLLAAINSIPAPALNATFDSFALIQKAVNGTPSLVIALAMVDSSVEQIKNAS